MRNLTQSNPKVIIDTTFIGWAATQRNDPANNVPVVSIYSSEDTANSANVYATVYPDPSESAVFTTSDAITTGYHIPGAFDPPAPIHQHTINKAYVSTSCNEYNFTENEAATVNAILSDGVSTSSSLQQPSSYEFMTSASSTQAPPQLQRPSSKTLVSGLMSRKQATGACTPISVSTLACGHHNTGQELCYLCHQRARRNVPVYVHEEVRQRELEEDQLLAQYQSLNDMEKKLKDDEKRNAIRLDRAKMDAFNLGVAEAIKQKKMERPKTSDLSVSINHNH